MALALIVLLVLIAAVRYGADTRDARDWSSPRPSAHPLPSTGHFGAHPTFRGDINRLARAARALLHRPESEGKDAVMPACDEAALSCC